MATILQLEVAKRRLFEKSELGALFGGDEHIFNSALLVFSVKHFCG